MPPNFDPGEIAGKARAGIERVMPGNKGVILYLFVGLLALFFGFSAHMISIQTTEAFVQHRPMSSFIPDFVLVGQLINLFTRNDASQVTAAVYLGWTVEVIYIIFIALHEHAKLAIKSANHELHGIYRFLIYVIVIVNLFTNLFYNSVSTDPFVQFFFALAVSFSGAFLVIIGLSAIELGLSNWKNHGVI